MGDRYQLPKVDSFFTTPKAQYVSAMEVTMGLLDSLFGRKKQTLSVPVCVSCGKPVAVGPRQVGGVKIYEGTECSGCGKIYCLYCHNFGIKGPKCPGCGEYRLDPLLRAS